MWGRVIGFGASFVAVVVAVGKGFLWLHDHVSREVLLGVAIVFIVVAAVSAILVNKAEGFSANPTEREIFRRLARLTPLVVAVALVAIFPTPAMLYAAIVVSLSVPVWALYEWDRSRYRICPDCVESVNRHAKVCKHCGFRFEPAATPCAAIDAGDRDAPAV